jgi:crotonobetainyl-CoA:carnitine CoA-transferase CaiB-like acyl-CoA transferase
VPYQAFAARDGHLVVAVGNDQQFARLLQVLGLDPDARFATNPLRLANRDALVDSLADRVHQRGRDELVAALEAADVPAGPVNAVSEALAAMESAHGGAWLQAADGMRLAPAPVLLDGHHLALRRPPPRLGQHTDEILGEAEVPADEIARLRRVGAIA